VYYVWTISRDVLTCGSAAVQTHTIRNRRRNNQPHRYIRQRSEVRLAPLGSYRITGFQSRIDCFECRNIAFTLYAAVSGKLITSVLFKIDWITVTLNYRVRRYRRIIVIVNCPKTCCSSCCNALLLTYFLPSSVRSSSFIPSLLPPETSLPFFFPSFRPSSSYYFTLPKIHVILVLSVAFRQLAVIFLTPFPSTHSFNFT